MTFIINIRNIISDNRKEEGNLEENIHYFFPHPIVNILKQHLCSKKINVIFEYNYNNFNSHPARLLSFMFI